MTLTYFQKDRIVRITIICELLFDAVPGTLSLLSSLLYSVVGVAINSNSYTFLMSSLDAAICSVVYAWILFRVFRSSSTPAMTACGEPGFAAATNGKKHSTVISLSQLSMPIAWMPTTAACEQEGQRACQVEWRLMPGNGQQQQ